VNSVGVKLKPNGVTPLSGFASGFAKRQNSPDNGDFLLERFADCAVALLDHQPKGALRNLNRLCRLPDLCMYRWPGSGE
jgi:hypothetical protein